MNLYAKSILVTAVGLVLLLFLGGCAYTLPNGDKVPREVYRTEANRDLMTLAVAADREYDARNPIQPPPAVCSDTTGLSGTDLAYCAMAMATYNSQLAVREMNRTANAQYASAVIDRQADERERKIDRWLNLGLTVYQTERQVRASSSGGPRISVKGPTVASRGSGGGAGAGGSGGDSGAAGGGAGGGAETGVNGDMNTVIVVGDGNQSGGGSGSTWSPSLQWATDLGSTNPSYGEGVQDNRTKDDNDSLLNGGVF